MSKVINIRNVRIGEGIPKIIIPIVGINNAELIEEVKGLRKIKFDMVEWRVDFYENVEDIEKVKEILFDIRKILSEVPILFTFRTKKEGGQKEAPLEYYIKLNCEIAKTKQVDLVDVELFTGDIVVKEIVDAAHKNGVKVVMSNHDFFKTPKQEEIVERLTNMINLKADIPKIAVMPVNESDVLTLLCATNEIKQNYEEQPIVTMSMSGMGVISRICGEFFGSVLTFGAAKKASAPGQIEVEDLNTILEILHKNK